MHLDYTRSVYKGKESISYRIAESVRTGDKVSKRILFSLGQLSPIQVKQIRLILRTLKDPNEVLIALSQVVPTRAVQYLDLAVANHYWDHWQLDLGFTERTESTLSTERVARILTLNRCIDPCSHYSLPRWVKRTALPEIFGVDLQELNDDKIYYELDRIEENKRQIQDHLLAITKRRNPESYEFVNYDLSTAYFVGIRCSLSRYGRGKDNQPYCRQVVLALLVNSEGYPFKWDVFPGNQAEVHTLGENVAACKAVGLNTVTMVFDRGLVSKKNLELLAATEGVKFISALDKSQIPKAPGVKLRPFANLPEQGLEAHLRTWPDFRRFDESVFFRDLGVIDGRRYVLSLNGNLLREERKLRRQKLRQFAAFLKAYNEDLRNAQRDRNREPTVRAVLDKLRTLKIARFFEDPVVRSITVRRRRKNGTIKQVTSFQIKLKRKDDAIKEAKLLDGVCVFISDHVEKRGRGYAMNARQIVQAYRDKTEIEDAFKNMKSFVKIRPFFVNTDTHVRAVFTICVLSYHLNKTLARARKEIEGKDFLNSSELYDPFVDCKMVTMKDPDSGTTITKVIPPSADTRSLLKRLDLSHLVRRQERRM